MSAIVSPNAQDWPSTVTGYWPDRLDRDDQDCYCRKPAHGRTVFWTGTSVKVCYHCREHLPVDPVMYPVVKR